MQKPNASRFLVSRLSDLSQFDVYYLPRQATKGKPLSDFIPDFTCFSKEITSSLVGKPWSVFIDYSFYHTSWGVVAYMVRDSRHKHHYMARLTIKTTNNEAKYEALVVGLSILEALGATKFKVKADSQVVVNQLLGVYITKGKKLKKYLRLT